MTRRSDDDFQQEIESHLAHEADELVRGGVPSSEAQHAARRAFGNPTRVAERHFEARRPLRMDALKDDVFSAMRSLRRYPVVSAIAILSLAGGIGAATAGLTVRKAVFVNPPPLYRDTDQLSTIQVGRRDRPVMPAGSHVPGALFLEWRRSIDVAGAAPTVIGDIRAGDRRANTPVRRVTANLFSLLGVQPSIGANFDNRPAGGAAILSDGAFARFFDRRIDAIGQTFWINDKPFVVAGVMPPRFWFGDMDSPVWTTVNDAEIVDVAVETVARRSSGVSGDELKARLEPALSAYAAALPAADRDVRIVVSKVGGTAIARQMSVALPYVLGAAVLFTLLIACANVAILLIAQWTSREQEIALRAALGAPRRRLIRSLLAESILVALIGGALGVAATFAIQQAILWNESQSLMVNLSIDDGILAQALLLALAAGLIAGIAPALYETRRVQDNPFAPLRSSERVRQRWRHTLVVAEITLTVAMLVVTAAMVTGYRRAMSAEMGFDGRALLALRVEHQSNADITRVLDAVRHVPGVTAASMSTSVPYMADGQAAHAANAASGGAVISVQRVSMTPEFFDTLGVLMQGRAFHADETPASGSAIINARLAAMIFPGSSAIGRQLWLDDVPVEIVGVVDNYATQRFRADDIPARVYLPFAAGTTPVRRVQLLVRAGGDSEVVVTAVRRYLRDVLPDHTVPSAFTFPGIVSIMGSEVLVGAAPLVPLVVIGLSLSAIGIYGVLAFAFARRTKELATRSALGATPRDLRSLVAGHGLRLVAMGSGLGIALTFILSRIVRSNGGAGTPLDPMWHDFVIPVLILMTVGMAATWLPARRASRIDPAIVLKER